MRIDTKHIGGWLLLWGALDLLCAMCCEIHADEAYYRLYGQFLDWGYFDHPPMVALMTALSALIVPYGTSLILKNLSVRLVTVLMHMATVYVVWRTIKPAAPANQPSVLKFLLIAASIPMFCAYGFMTTPDAPLLFFAALFYYAYRRLMNERVNELTSERVTVALLGISMAGMLYSKYMALLVILFAVIGNRRLLVNPKAWAAVGLAAVLMIPHLWWQYAHGFPSIVHQWGDRAVTYQAFFTLDYIPNQWAAFNPVVWVLMLWAGVRAVRSGDAYARSMGVTVWGFQLFFLLMTVRQHVEPHWTIVTAIPAIILLTEDWQQAADNSLFRWKGVRIALYSCVALVLAARIVLMLNVLPAQTGLAGKQAYYEELHRQAEGRPVIFGGSFQHASLYRFFYDDQAARVRQRGDRYNQFDLWHLENEWMGKPACIMRYGKVTMTDALTEEDLSDE